jgi:hypothetical protein
MSFHGSQKERLSDTLQLSLSGSSRLAGGSAGWLLEGKSAHSLQFTFLSNSVPVTVTMPFFPHYIGISHSFLKAIKASECGTDQSLYK